MGRGMDMHCPPGPPRLSEKSAPSRPFSPSPHAYTMLSETERLFVWLPNVSASSHISGTDLLRQSYVLPH